MRNDTQQMLDERLRTLDPVDRDTIGSAHLHAQALMHSILSGERPLHASDVRQRMRPARQPRAFDLGRVGSLAAALIVALVVCGITTPPGKAVTRWVGQRIGIATGSSPRTGQPGGQPSLQSLRDFAHQGASAAGGQPAIVMARGNLPYGRHYEVVAYRPKPAGRGTGTGRVCFELDFPEVRSLGTLGCELPARSTSLVFQEAGENATATRSFSYATGLVGNDVTEVDVSTHGHPADVQLIRIPPNLLKRFGVDRPIKLFMATFATPAASGPLTVTTHNATGARLDEQSTTTTYQTGTEPRRRKSLGANP